MPGGLAPQVMAWQRRMGAPAGPLGAGGEASNGQPLQVELRVDGAWVDVTRYVLTRDGSGNVSITRGQRDEASEVEFSTCRFDLNNRDGRFSPRNPTSPYYGKLGRNQPLRVSVPGPTGGKAYRFWGEVSSWPQRWDISGTDVWVELEAAGIMRRLAQGAAPAHSVIYNAITDPQLTGLRAYWPCEDAVGSTRLASALTSGSAMTISGTATLASYDGFAASDPLPDVSAASLSGGVAKYPDPTATQVRFLIHIPVDGLADGQVLCAVDQVDASPVSPATFWELRYMAASNSVSLWSFAADGSFLGVTLDHTLDIRGRQMRISIELQTVGATISRAIRITDLSSLATYSVTDTQAASLTRVTRVQLGPATRGAVGPFGTRGLPNTAVGHVTVQDVITSVDDLGVRLSPAGETAGRRIQRLCGKEGIPFDWIGSLDDTPAMGGQSRLKPLELMQECSAADDGVLYENLSVFGLGYRTRASLYNQDPALTLSYAGHQLSDVPTPVDDDQLTRNRVTVTLPGGASAVQSLDAGPMSTQDPPAGIGIYGQDVTLNLEDDSTLPDQAAWRLHLGTVDEARYPQISVNLAHSTFVNDPALRAAVLALREGDRLVITDPPSWLPPEGISQLVLGLSETIDHFEHRIALNCAPASPYTVGVLDDAVLGRLDTGGSVLWAAAGTAATTIDVLTTSGPLWTSASADFPFSVQVGGEVMSVTGVTGVISDGFNRTVNSGWGSSDTGDTWTTSGGSASDFSVVGV